MKTRNGFVSNSSSSSFVLVAEKEVFEKVWEKAHPYVKAMASKGMFLDVDFGDTPCVIAHGETHSEDSPIDYLSSDYDGEILDTNGNPVKKGRKTLKMQDFEDNYGLVYEYEIMTMENALSVLAQGIMKMNGKIIYR